MENTPLPYYSHVNTNGFSEHSVPKTRGKKWPVLFWAILKVLCLFYQKRVVTSRKCYRCEVTSRVTRLDNLRRADPECGTGTDDVILDQLALAYDVDESGAAEERPRSINRTPVMEMHIQNRDVLCETCCAHWWNGYGVPVPYTEEDIGVNYWNHRGSGLLSIALLLVQSAVLWYSGGVLLYEMWGRPEQILHLLMRVILLAWLSIYPILALLTKVRSPRSGFSAINAWATVFSVRYLIKQGQFLNLHTRGLPGKPFLLLCSLSPVFVMGSRMFVLIHFGECAPSAGMYLVATSIIGVISSEIWGMFIYILYFVRASFHRQFNLQIANLRKHEGKLKKCKGALFATAMDFSCFRQFVDFFTALMFPFAICAVIANVSWNYLVGSDSCLGSDNHTVQIYLAIVYWTEIGVAIFLYLLAIGGFRVGYMWERFLLNLLQFKASGDSAEFWREIIDDMARFGEGSKVLLASVVVSVIGIYAGMKLSDQSVIFLAPNCNTTTPVCA